MKNNKSEIEKEIIKIIDINQCHCEICHNPIIYSKVGIVCCECLNKEFYRGKQGIIDKIKTNFCPMCAESFEDCNCNEPAFSVKWLRERLI